MTRRRSPLLTLLFALLLVFGQQQASVHAFEHEFEHLRSDTKSTGHPDTVCAKCLVFAHLDHPGDAATFAFAATAGASSVDRPAHRADPAIVAVVRYHSRAPPLFS